MFIKNWLIKCKTFNIEEKININNKWILDEEIKELINGFNLKQKNIIKLMKQILM